NKEKQEQINKLELSKQKLQNAFELLENREHSLNEASKIAKIGYWEYDSLADTVVWSDYIYYLYGADSNKLPLSQKDIVANFEEESQKKLIKANEILTTKGTPYDIEL